MGLRIFEECFHGTFPIFNSSSKFQERNKGRKERRWRPFHATDFQSLMYPSFIFCRILGVFPYKINTFEISKPWYILSAVIKCVMCFYVIIVFYMVNDSEWSQTKNIRRLIELNAFFTFSSFIMIFTYISNGPRMRLLRTIRKISSGLSSESYQKQSRLIHARDIFGSLYLSMQVSIYLVMRFPVLLKVFSTYVTLIVFQMDMLYINCVCVLKACFKKINDDLAKLLVMNNESHLFGIYHEQRNPFLLMELKALKKYHLSVSNTVQMLNIIFSPQLLASVVMTFIRITFCLYYCLILCQDAFFQNAFEYQTESEKRVAYILFISSILHYFIKITLTVWACETCKNQAVEIGITVHDVLNSINDKQVKKELQLFSMQILHNRRNTFSVKGLTMGAPLFAALMGSITTYLLILIQFMKIYNFCNE